MTREIQQSFKELLNQTSWIDDETKELATEKVNAMLLRIGYPDFILQPELLNERYKDVRTTKLIFFFFRLDKEESIVIDRFVVTNIFKYLVNF